MGALTVCCVTAAAVAAVAASMLVVRVVCAVLSSERAAHTQSVLVIELDAFEEAPCLPGTENRDRRSQTLEGSLGLV